MKLSKYFTVVIAFFVFVVALFALSGETVADNVDTGDSGYNIYFRPAIRWGTNDRVLYIVDFLIPLYLGDKNILFANPKFTPNDRDGWEYNVGLGYRHLLLDDNLLLGINAFYDRRKADSGNYFSQWGIGIEAMADIPLNNMDLGLTGRFNFYCPITDTKLSYGEGGAGGGGYLFQDLGIYSMLGGELIVEEPMRGFDYEAGVRIPYLSDYVETWAYAGGYNYFGKYTEHVDGFAARLEIIPTDFLRLNFEYKYDNINHDEFYGEVAVEVPFSITNLVQGKNPFEGIGRRFSGSRELKERMVEPVRRDVDIVVVEKTVVTEGGGGGGGLIEEVIFVSEGGETDPLADGTFEHPWPSVDAAIAGDARLGVTAFTIHIINDNGGDGFAGGGNFNAVGAIANLIIWGSGAGHPIYGGINNMTSGFPEMNTMLTVDDAGAEILGIYFNNPANWGLVVQGGPNTLVHDNRINANGAHGMELQGFNNTSIYSNTFTGGASFRAGVHIGAGSGVNIYSNTFNGVEGVSGNAGGTNVTINNNTFNSVEYGIHMYYGGNNIDNFTITNNTINVNNSGGSAIGIYLETNAGGAYIGSSGSPINISNNTINVTASANAAGVWITSDNNIFANINNNSQINVTATGSAWGAYLSANGLIGSTATVPSYFQNNSGTINGTANRYLLELWTGTSGGGNSVNWSGNSFTPVGGGGIWSGSYGPSNEVQENFTIPPDVITP